MEILITGGNGLLGRHLVDSLLERGEHVRVLALADEDTGWLDARGVTVHRGDVRLPRTLTAATGGVDAVMHLAGMMGVWRPLPDYHAVNVEGTENVCRAALAAGARVVHVSSWTVYGMGLAGPVREDSPIRPFREPYATTKAAGDLAVQRMVRQDGLAAVIVRPGTFFGPHDRLHFARMADRIRAGRAIIVGRGDNALPFVYVEDVVRGLLLALDNQSALGQAYNISNDYPLTQQQFVHAIARGIGARPPRIHISYRALYAAGYAAERVSALMRSERQPIVTRLGVKVFGSDNRHSIEKARRELGFEPEVSLLAGVSLAADWYREHCVGEQSPAAGLAIVKARASATSQP